MRDLIDGDSAGELSGHRPTHPITYRKDEIAVMGGRLPKLSQVMIFECIELKTKEGIFIVRSNLALVRQPKPLKLCRDYVLSVHHPILRSREGSLKTQSRSSRSARRIVG